MTTVEFYRMYNLICYKINITDFVLSLLISNYSSITSANTLKSPDARIIPPRIERGKKWLGEGIGWES